VVALENILMTDPTPPRYRGPHKIMDIDEITVGPRVRKDMGDLDALAASIDEMDLLQPIGVNEDGVLVCGERRLRAVQKLGWGNIPVHICHYLDDTVALLKAEAAENLCRKPFLPSEAVSLGLALEVVAREEAKKRQATSTGGADPQLSASGKFPEADKGQTRDKVAESLGMLGRTYEKAKAVVVAAQAEPEKYGALLEEMDSSGKVTGAYRALQKARAAEEIAAEPPCLPEGPFRVIVVDPPWAYGKRAGDLTQRGATTYPTMSQDELKALPVGTLAHEDCVLWLWTTNAHMRDAFELLDAWGFTHKTILTWVKDRMGTGDWLRGRTEHCLMAVRGKPTVTLTNQTTAIEGPLREHSRKPEEFYALVESLCPGSRVELFCRTERKGWASHGTKLDRFKHGETT
jgi:N6-adenosine-specific RNA methylase IME4/ParB-like chromosome segregation protein Spo0J